MIPPLPFRPMAGMALLVLCAGASAADVPPAEENVKAHGAVGDGKADDTAAFEQALALTRGQAGTVRVPPGRYRLTRPLVLHTQTLLGATAAAWVADEQALPTLLPEAMDGPCLRLQAGGAVHGLQFWFDWGTAKPSPRPPAIELAGVGCRVTETKIFGAWDGIMADGTNNVGRASIEKCFLVNVHNTGIRLTGTWDSSWISKVEIWSPASETFLKSGTGFLIGKNDMLIMSDTFVFSASVGYRLLDAIPGCTIEGGMWGSMNNCTSDYCGLGVVVDGAHTVSIVGGTYWTHFGGITVKGNRAQVRISGLELGANGGPALNLEGGNLVTVGACQIRRVFKGFDQPALRVTGGDAVIISGCVIDSSSTGVDVAPSLKNVVLSGNIVREHLEPPTKGVTDR